MSEPEQHLTLGMQLGDYLLKELIYEGPTTKTWLATQISVNREVIIDSLNREVQADDAIVNTFLSDVRTKAKIDHPLIGSVFEAVKDTTICFYTREKIAGKTIQEYIDEGSQLSPEQTVHIIKQIAEANLYLESHDVASLPLATNHIYVSSTNMCRIINMAVGGQRDHSVSTQDKAILGNAFLAILQNDAPGSTRTKSLLSYMADTEREIPLAWDQIRELSDGVERQLTEPPELTGLDSQTMKLRKQASSKRLITSISIALAVLIVGIFTYLITKRDKPPKKRQLEGEVLIKAGDYLSFDGRKAKLKTYLIDAHEVTIAEYAAFLKEVDLIEPSSFETYQHESHPNYKESHRPDDWDALYKAAKNGSIWNGLKVTLNHPVIGIDWWDAYTYASFYARRLPTQDEWMAAITSANINPEKLSVSPWGSVDQQSADITPNKIHGLAGNVSEWTLKMTKPPHDPTASYKRPVICGAAHNNSNEGASRREWLQRNSSLIDARDTRRNNLGFRTVSQPESN